MVADTEGRVRVASVAEVGEDALLVHDARRADPSLAFALARLGHFDAGPTPMGVFRAVERPEFAHETSKQLAAAVERRGPGDLAAVLRSRGTWHTN